MLERRIGVLALLSSLFFLSACDSPKSSKLTGDLSSELPGFVERVKSSQVFVEGGEFMMGDFGELYGAERLPYDWDKDSKPLHQVKLSGYFIDRFKIRNEDFQFYLKYNGLSLRSDVALLHDYADLTSLPNNPAPLDWFEAEKYCSWLGAITGLDFALPTEAQWEYAARSRGGLPVSTNNGAYELTDVRVSQDNGPRGINISTAWDRKDFSKEMGWRLRQFSSLPVDRFPPNSLGVYSMTDNGREWVNDWYDPEYYKVSPVQDPQGPEVPVYRNHAGQSTKVMRGQSYSDPVWRHGINVHREGRSPDADFANDGHKRVYSMTARCVVNGSRI